MALFYTGHLGDALACFKHAAALEPTAEFIGNLAHAYRWLGVEPKAKAQYELAILRAREEMRTEQDGLLLSDLALFYAALGKKDLALAYLQQAEQKSPVNLDVLYKHAVAMSLLGLQERALEDLQRLSSKSYPIAFASSNPDLLSLHRFAEFQHLRQAIPHE
jgi:tetratricopeptide (TPR) repeat protein